MVIYFHYYFIIIIRVHHLVLADPWGFPEEKKDINKKIPWWVKGIFYVLKPLNPLWPVRFAGPFGKFIINGVSRISINNNSEITGLRCS